MTTLVDLLSWRSQSQPERVTYRFLESGEAVTAALTNRELAEQAQAVAARLQEFKAGGKQVLLLLPPGLDYIVAFFGCLCAGAIAVPIYPPRRNRSRSRLQAIIKNAQPRVVLTTASLLSDLDAERSELGLTQCRWLAVDTVEHEWASQWQAPTITAESLAFLQYTSGSTAAPKGVMVSHRNLLHNLNLIRQRFAAQSAEDVTVSWLPPYHDMGLIGGILEPLYDGSPVILMPPVAFLQRPIRWLQAIAQFQATVSGGPNFAYELCCQRITDSERAALDLSSWELAFNGAEAVRADTLARFTEVFASCGFRSSAFYPCYGMAETTLLVTGGHRQIPPVCKTVQAAALARHQVIEAAPEETAGSRTLVGCGQVPPEQTVIIVHPKTRRRCEPNQVGEIWVSGPSVAQGYWQQPEATAAGFQAALAENAKKTFLRTGDLGFLADNELFVTGRLKDLVIIRGRNHYPQDLERTAARSHSVLRADSGAAFAVSTETEERLVVVHEVERRAVRGLDHSATADIARSIRQAIAAEHDLQV
ncbi:MAG: fatty acyl-AMP ligase, partial [Cyanobacteria bacterium P01_D01_bin.128]